MAPIVPVGYSPILEPGNDDPATHSLGVTLAAFDDLLVTASVKTKSIEVWQMVNYEWTSLGTVMMPSLAPSTDEAFVSMAQSTLNIVIKKRSDGVPCILVSIPELDKFQMGQVVDMYRPLYDTNPQSRPIYGSDLQQRQVNLINSADPTAIFQNLRIFTTTHPFVSTYQRNFAPLKAEYRDQFGKMRFTYDVLWDDSTGQTFDDVFDLGAYNQAAALELIYDKQDQVGARTDVTYISTGSAYLFTLHDDEWVPSFEMHDTAYSKIGGGVAMSDDCSTLVLTASGSTEKEDELFETIRTTYYSYFYNRYYWNRKGLEPGEVLSGVPGTIDGTGWYWYRDARRFIINPRPPTGVWSWEDDVVSTDVTQSVSVVTLKSLSTNDYVLTWQLDDDGVYQPQPELAISKTDLKQGIYPSLAVTSISNATVLALEAADGVRTYLKAPGPPSPWSTDEVLASSYMVDPAARQQVLLSQGILKPKLVIKSSSVGKQCIDLFERDGNWAQVTSLCLPGYNDLIAPESIAMSKDGTKLIIGHPTADFNKGAVDLYELNGAGTGYVEVGSFEGGIGEQIGRYVSVAEEDVANGPDKYKVFFGSSPSDATGSFLVYGYELDVTFPKITAPGGQMIPLSFFMGLDSTLTPEQAMTQVLNQFADGEVYDSGDNENPFNRVLVGTASAVSSVGLAKVIENARQGLISSPLKVKYQGSDLAGNTKSNIKRFAIMDDVAPNFEVCVGGVSVSDGDVIPYEAGDKLPVLEFKNLEDQDGTGLKMSDLYLNVAAPGATDPNLVPYSPEALENIVDCYTRTDSNGMVISPDNFNPKCMAAGKYLLDFNLKDAAGNYKKICFTVYVTDSKPPEVNLQALSEMGFDLVALLNKGVEVEGDGIKLRIKKKNAIADALHAERVEMRVPNVADLEKVTSDKGDECAGKKPVIVRSHAIINRLKSDDYPQEVAQVRLIYTAIDTSDQHPINTDLNSGNLDRVPSTSVEFKLLVKDTIAPVVSRFPSDREVPWVGKFENADPMPVFAGDEPAISDKCWGEDELQVRFEDEDKPAFSVLWPEFNEDFVVEGTRRVIKRKWFGSDGSGNEKYLGRQTIKYNDSTPPIIGLKGSRVVTLVEGESYPDPGVKVSDEYSTLHPNETLNLMNSVQVATELERDENGKVSTDGVPPGTYTMTYTVFDFVGNKSEATCRVIVVTPAPKRIHLTSMSTQAEVDKNLLIKLGAISTDEFKDLDNLQDGALHFTWPCNKARASFWFKTSGYNQQNLVDLGDDELNIRVKNDWGDFFFVPTKGAGPGKPVRPLPPHMCGVSHFPFGYEFLPECKTLNLPGRCIAKDGKAGKFNLVNACVSGRESFLPQFTYSPDHYNSAIDYAGGLRDTYKLSRDPASKDETGEGEARGVNLNTVTKEPRDGTTQFTSQETRAPKMFDQSMEFYKSGNLQDRGLKNMYIKTCMAKSFGPPGYALGEMVDNETEISEAFTDACTKIIDQFQSKLERNAGGLVLSEEQLAGVMQPDDGSIVPQPGNSTVGVEMLNKIYNPKSIEGAPRSIMKDLLTAVRNKVTDPSEFEGATGPDTFKDRMSERFKNGFIYNGDIFIPAKFEVDDTIEFTMTFVAKNPQSVPGTLTVSTAAGENSQPPSGTGNANLLGNEEEAKLEKATMAIRCLIHITGDEDEEQEEELVDLNQGGKPYPGRPDKNNFSEAEFIKAKNLVSDLQMERSKKIKDLVGEQSAKAAAQEKLALAEKAKKAAADRIAEIEVPEDEGGLLALAIANLNNVLAPDVIKKVEKRDLFKAAAAAEGVTPDHVVVAALEDAVITAQQAFQNGEDDRDKLLSELSEKKTDLDNQNEIINNQNAAINTASSKISELISAIETLTKGSLLSAVKQQQHLAKRSFLVDDLQNFETALIMKWNKIKDAILTQKNIVHKLTDLIKQQEMIITNIQKNLESDGALLYGETDAAGNVGGLGAPSWNSPTDQNLLIGKYNTAKHEIEELNKRLIEPTATIAALNEAKELAKLGINKIANYFNEAGELNIESGIGDLLGEFEKLGPKLWDGENVVDEYKNLLSPLVFDLLFDKLIKMFKLWKTISALDAGSSFGRYLQGLNDSFDYVGKEETGVVYWDGTDSYGTSVEGDVYDDAIPLPESDKFNQLYIDFNFEQHLNIINSYF